MELKICIFLSTLFWNKDFISQETTPHFVSRSWEQPDQTCDMFWPYFVSSLNMKCERSVKLLQCKHLILFFLCVYVCVWLSRCLHFMLGMGFANTKCHEILSLRKFTPDQFAGIKCCKIFLKKKGKKSLIGSLPFIYYIRNNVLF